MATFKATNKKSNNTGTFKATNRKSYDSGILYEWEQANRESLGVLNQYNERINKSEWLTKEDRATYRKALDTYIETANNLRGINKTFGEGYTEEDEKSWLDSVSSMNEAYASTDRYYSQWVDEKDYKGQRDGWFQSSNLFDDGYQFGDVLGTIAGSTTDLVKNIGTGILGIGESALDALAMMGQAQQNQILGESMQSAMGLAALTGKDVDEVVNIYTDLQNTSKEATAEFVKKDLYNEEAIAKAIIAEPVKALTGIDAETDSVFGKKTDGLVQSAGQLVGTAGLQAVGVPWWLTTGVTTFGGESQNALNQGATFEEAAFSGLVSAGAEILTEKISSAISFGGKTLEDLLPNLTAKISNKVVRKLLDLGIDMVGEGGEEILSGFMSAIGQKLTYASDKEISELFSSEDALDSFIGGAVLGSAGSVIGDARQTISKNKQALEIYGDGADLVTEALDIDPNNALAQKMQTKLDKGKKLSGGQLNRLVQANESALVSQDKGKMKSAVEARLTELGETGDVSVLAEALVKKKLGEKLTKAESKAISESVNSDWALEELDPDSPLKNEAEYSNWAEGIGTERINYEAYNRSTPTSEGINAPEAKKDILTEDSPEKDIATEGEISASTDAKTTIERDGEEVEVNIDKIESIDNGEISVKLESGETVDIADIKIGGQMALVYQAASEMATRVGGFNVDTANVFVRGYDPSTGLTAAEYVHGFSDAYRFGKLGYPVSELESGVYTSKLTDEQRTRAYNFGKVFGNDKVAEKQAKIDSFKEKNAGQKAQKGKVRYYDNAVRAKGAKQKSAVKAAEVLAESLGNKWYFYASYVDESGNRVFKDFDGTIKEAPNGWYEPSDGSIHIDLNAGSNGEGLVIFTMAHELTHRMRDLGTAKFKIFADALLEEYTKNGQSIEKLIKRKLKTLADKGRLKGKTEEQAYDLAYEEVIADSCEAMLVDSDAITEVARKLKAKDTSIWEKIKDFIAKLVARIKAAYKGLSPDSYEANLVRDMADAAERLQKLWVDALLDTREVSTDKTLIESGIFVDSKTESASLMSVRDLLTDADRKKVSKALAERFGVTQTEAIEWLRAETSLASLILNPKYSQYLDYTADANEVAIKQNSDYPQGTVDFSNICKKRRAFTEVMNRVLRNFPNHVFEATDLAKIRSIMMEEKMEVACGICYVEDRRQLDSIVAQNFIDSLALYRSGSKYKPDGTPFNANQLKAFKLIEGDTYTPSIYELISLEGRNSLKAKNPAMEEAWVKFNNARGMQSVRLLLNDAEYKRQILKYSPAVVKRKNDLGGLRIYSFSDMEMFHLIDIIQVVTDSATVGLSLQGYTKVNEYAKAVKDTGEKLNRSLIPKGDLGYHIENGRVVLDFDTVEGIDINHPDFFDNIDNPNIGNIVIGINATQIKAAMTSKFIDQIIPFHTGQSNEVLGEKGIASWDNYKDFQSERDAKTKKKSSHQINIYTEVINAAEAEGHPITNKVEFVNKFLEVCKENNLIPRFSDFLDVNENGEYIYTEGYHKFLVDFKTFDQNTGEYLPQMPVKPIFDNKYITKLLTDYVESQKVKDAEFTKAMPKVIDRITKEIVNLEDAKYSDRASEKSDFSVRDAQDNEFSENALEKYSKAEYNSFGWARAVGAISFNELNDLYSKIKGRTSLSVFNHSSKGEAIIEVNNKPHSTLDVNNVFVFVKGTKNSFVITRAVRFQAETETEMEIFKEDIYEGRTCSDTHLAFLEQKGFARQYTRESAKSFAEYQRLRESGETSGRTDSYNRRSKYRSGYSLSTSEDGEITEGNSRIYSDRPSQKALYAPTFYSHMGKVIDDIKLEKMGTSSILNHLKNRGVKDEEIKWSGIETFLEGKKSVTKAELQEFVAGSQLQIEEEMSGEEAWNIVKDGENYIVKDKDGNILETWEPTQDPGDPDMVGWISLEGGDIASTIEEIREYTSDWYGDEGTRWSQYRLDGGTNYRELVFKMPNSTYSNNAMRAHWGQEAEGVLAHARIQDFEVDGKKMLFIEELQSDWHNEGHQRGYITEEYEEAVATYNRLMEDHLKKRKAFHQYVLNDDFNRDQSEGNYTKFNELRSESETAEKRMQAAERDVDALKEKGMGDVPDAPFKNNYHEYVLKRLLRMAAEEGYDSIGWTTADIQSERWSDQYAEGYRIEYDQDIPKFLRKYGKKWGATVGTTLLGADDIGTLEQAELDAQAKMLDAEKALAVARLRGDQAEIERLNLDYLAAMNQYSKALDNSVRAKEGTKVWSMSIPDSMKQSVLTEGQPLYSDRNTASFKGKAFWSGSVSLLDGVIEEVHTMEEAEDADFHHSMYFSQAQVEKMANEENAFFFVENGKVQGDWRVSIPEDIIERIKEQITIAPKYQDRDTDSYSNRSLLANALESTIDTSTPEGQIALNKLQEYKGIIGEIEKLEAERHGIVEKATKLQRTKGKTSAEIKEMKDLWFESKQIANRINTYDGQLLRIEAMKPIQKLLYREKKMAYQRAAQRGRDALAAYREKAAKTQRELLTRYQESRKKGIVSRNKTAMRHKIKDVVNELNQYLLKGTKDKHIPIELQKSVAEALDAVNMDTVGAEERIARLKAEMMRAKTPEAIQEIAKKIEHIEEMGGNMEAKLSRLKTAYDNIINSEDPIVANSHDEVISNTIQRVVEEVGETPLRDMSLGQLEAVYDMYRMVLHSIRTANKAFKAKKSEEISVIANRVLEEIDKLGKKGVYRTKVGDAASTFDWNNLKPVYAFERINSDTFTEVFNNVRAGEDTWAVDMTEAQEYLENQKKKHKYDSWDFNKSYTFTSSTGKKFSLSLGQIMSLYAYSKRGDQAKDHLKNGGFVFDGLTEVKRKTKAGITVTYQLKDATAYNLSDEILGDIISKLSEEQKAFADVMQDYLSTTMGEKGNEVSLELYGVKLFKEKNYFPLKSAPQFLERAREQAQGDVKIKNKGFTKETTPKARNPIVLTSFMDVWAGHVNEMSMYHAFTLALEDFHRVYNYKTPASETLDSESVISFLENAHGAASVSYIDQLIKDLNGGARSDPRETFAKALMSRFKKTAVMGSLSVVVQQPTSIIRAMALVDAKYFGVAPITRGVIKAFNIKKHKALWAEVKKYAPVAIIKEMGYFDTGMGKSSVEWLKGEKTFMDKVDDVLSKAPAVADELAWISIWEAVKRETASKNPTLKTNSEEFLKLAGERFTEVITKTQVYDSTLSKSSNMRSKSAFMNMWTAFMAEPTTTINMVADAFRKGNKKYAAKVLGATVGSVALNAALVSLVYAMRDDDEDETFTEKYLSRVTTEFIDGINPVTYIPFFKDVWSIMQGFDIERADMSLITDLIGTIQTASKTLSKDTSDMDDEELKAHMKEVSEALWGIVDSASSLAGIPVKNIRRDSKGINNLFKTLGRDMDTTFGSLMDNITEDLQSSTPIWNWAKKESKGDKLYDAIISGDTAYVDRLKSGYKDESTINTAIRKALRENDPRIKEAAKAVVNGKGSDYSRLVNEIVNEGNFERKIVTGAIAAEVEKMRNADK